MGTSARPIATAANGPSATASPVSWARRSSSTTTTSTPAPTRITSRIDVTSVITLLAMSGSLRAASSNAALLEAARLLAPTGIAIEHYRGLGDLPHFNPDLDVAPLPLAVVDLRRRIGAADGLLISCPEYA